MTRPFSSQIYADEAQSLEMALSSLPWDEGRAQAVQKRARELVARIRARKGQGGAGQIHALLQRYSLNTEEGIALMRLAEALLRIPDNKTANALIRDMLSASSWSSGGAADWVVKAAGIGLFVTRRTMDSALSRIGEPFVRGAMMKAMRMMGDQFVIGEDIESAMQNAQPYIRKGYRMSYDILGEGARTALDAERYFQSYAHAIEYVGARAGNDERLRPGLSVKLSALHPRYSYAQRERCVPAMTERLSALARRAAALNISLTVDAEEAERLEISLDIIEGVLSDPALKGWEGFGLAAQAYQKRAPGLMDYLTDLAKTRRRRLQIRLVKGAYWDSEIKRAQVLGLENFPVFTRKANTDVSYLACAYKLLQARDYVFPLFGTHNAHAAAAIIEMAGRDEARFGFQALFGMDRGLFDLLLEDGFPCAGVYAPVGPHDELLPYLVRRLLENGANASFVNKLLNPDEPVENLVRDPVAEAAGATVKSHSKIAQPQEIYAREEPRARRNSQGLDLNDPRTALPLLKEMGRYLIRAYDAPALIGGKFYKDSAPEVIVNPANSRDAVGRYWPASKGLADKAFRIASDAFPAWKKTGAEERAATLERAADLIEENRAELMALCAREAGKTIPDALAEIREAVDYCRYYANRGRADFTEEGRAMPGPTGESNVLKLEGRGVFVCISPWNFPLAIFTGQVTAALMAGNCVIAKPAEQTPLIALKAVQLLHRAGIPEDVLHLLPGDGLTGAAAINHPRIAGAAFTGSTSVAREINMNLADNRGPIVPLIAETGGQNAMIVDSSALPEQVVDDVILSAFGSTGQRCSSLRVLFLQSEVADKILRLFQGAMAELKIGDPAELSTDIGPVIDAGAMADLRRHREALKGFGKLIFETPMDEALKARGHFFPPCAYELNDMEGLEREIFGPILHVIRYRRDEIDRVIEQINAAGYGLTLGVHSRIDSFHESISARIRVGNVYVNRSMIGAVVGTQPFGGQGLSGTGPKAGGPHYLPRFASEKVVSVNAAAAGGNAALASLGE